MGALTLIMYLMFASLPTYVYLTFHSRVQLLSSYLFKLILSRDYLLSRRAYSKLPGSRYEPLVSCLDLNTNEIGTTASSLSSGSTIAGYILFAPSLLAKHPRFFPELELHQGGTAAIRIYHFSPSLSLSLLHPSFSSFASQSTQ